MKRKQLAIALAIAAFAAPATATVLYTDGPENSSIGGSNIATGSETSDSFTLAVDALVTQIEFVVWDLPVDLNSGAIHWAITSARDLGGTSYGSGFVGFTPTYIKTISHGVTYDVYDATFNVSVPLLAGTYWLDLNNAAEPGLQWEINGGPSSSFTNGSPSAFGGNTFSILGNVTQQQTAPEPGSVALIGAGLLGLAFVVRRPPRS